MGCRELIRRNEGSLVGAGPRERKRFRRNALQKCIAPAKSWLFAMRPRAHPPVKGPEPWYCRQSQRSPRRSRTLVILYSDLRCSFAIDLTTHLPTKNHAKSSNDPAQPPGGPGNGSSLETTSTTHFGFGTSRRQSCRLQLLLGGVKIGYLRICPPVHRNMLCTCGSEGHPVPPTPTSLQAQPSQPGHQIEFGWRCVSLDDWV